MDMLITRLVVLSYLLTVCPVMSYLSIIHFLNLSLSCLPLHCFALKSQLLSLSSLYELESLPASPSIVVYHASWCGACQRLLPEVKRAADTLSAYNNPSVSLLSFLTIDCSDSPSSSTRKELLCLPEIVQSYPTIVYYPGGLKDFMNREVLRGMRTASDFVKFARIISGPDYYVVKDDKELNDIYNSLSFALSMIVISVGPRDQVRGKQQTLEYLTSLMSTIRELKPWVPTFLIASEHRCKDEKPSKESIMWICISIETPPKVSSFMSSNQVLIVSNEFKGSSIDEVVSFETNPDLGEWVLGHLCPGLWKLREENFLPFMRLCSGDKSGRRVVLIAIDYSSKSSRLSESRIHANLINSKDCEEARDHFNFALIDYLTWSKQLSDFGLSSSLVLPYVLVFSDLRFEEYWSNGQHDRLDIASVSFCSLGLVAGVLHGQIPSTLHNTVFLHSIRKLIFAIADYANASYLSFIIAIVGLLSPLVFCFGFVVYLGMSSGKGKLVVGKKSN